MSISIIDNFQVGTSKPIDNRLVVGPGLFYNNRDNIQNKYTGLRIWDINDDKAYVWRNNNWSEEYKGGNVALGTTGSIPKFASSTTLGDSIIQEKTGKIVVSGILQASSLVGSGTGITAIRANNITSGSLSPARLVGGNNEVLVGNGSGSIWTNLNNLTVGTSKKVSLSNSDSSIVAHYLIFTSTNSTSQQLFSNESIAYQPSSGNFSLSTTDFNNKLTVNGSVSIGTTETAPDSGLLVGGPVKLKGLSQSDGNTSNTKLSIVSDLSGNLMIDSGTTVPIGGIIMWSGFIENIPNGFVICDGCTYITQLTLSYSIEPITTPDLRQKFLIGTGNSPSVQTPNPLDIGQESTFIYTDSGDNSITYYSIYYIMYIGYPIINVQCG
jgi:hypothetical protein